MRVLTTLMLATSFLLVACGGEDSSTNQQSNQTAKKRDCVIKYGWEPRQPYQFNLNGEMQGIDIEIFKAAADQINCDLEYVEKSWSELLAGIEKGEIDVLGGATPTDERKVYAEFSDPYRDESFSLFITFNDDYDGDTLSGFLSRGNKIGITSDYFYGQDVYELMQHPQYSQLFIDEKSGEQSFFNVLYSRINGVLVDPIEGHYIIKRKGLDKKIRESNVKIPSDSVSYMFSKKTIRDDKLVKLKHAISEMVMNDKVQTIISNY